MSLEQANVIDVIFYDETTSCVTLIMTEPRAWDGSDLQLFQLQEKINAYLSFALDGEMVEAYPQFAGKALKLVLECAAMPEGRTLELLKVVHEQVAFQNIKFEVHVKNGAGSVPSPSSCGSGCGCRANSPSS